MTMAMMMSEVPTYVPYMISPDVSDTEIISRLGDSGDSDVGIRLCPIRIWHGVPIFGYGIWQIEMAHGILNHGTRSLYVDV